jgi:hypothetical protein
MVAHSEGEYFQKTQYRMQLFDEDRRPAASQIPWESGVREPRSYRNSTGALNLGHGGPDHVGG